MKLMTFVIRVHRAPGVLRGEVVVVESGAARLFDDLGEALAFVRDSAGGENGTPAAHLGPDQSDHGGGGNG